MPNLHPPFSAFPFALFVATILIELVSLGRSSPHLTTAAKISLMGAAIGTVLAFLSGYEASEIANQTFTVSDEIIAEHHNIGRLLLFSALPCLALRILLDKARFYVRTLRFIYAILLLTCLGLVTYCGYLGGELVFGHGAGVRADPQNMRAPTPLQ